MGGDAGERSGSGKGRLGKLSEVRGGRMSVCVCVFVLRARPRAVSGVRAVQPALPCRSCGCRKGPVIVNYQTKAIPTS
eukprot:1177538-Prorocentrum_minimum.AAC.2